MIEDIQRLLDEYMAWLKDRTTLRAAGDNWVEITTPYLDRHNDYIQIYAKKEDGGYVLTDDGYTVEDLRRSGCALDTRKRQDLLNVTLAGFGVQNNREMLEVRASSHDFALRKHNLLQAMLAVNDLFYLAEPVVASLFYEDVQTWLDTHEIRYTPRVKFAGRSGYDHQFAFVIPRSRAKPERILETVNRPGKEQAEIVAFKWIDTREVRPRESRAYALLNDQQGLASTTVVAALRNYEVTPVLWSQREAIREELAA